MDIKDLEIRVNNRNAVSYWKDGVMVGRKCTKCGKDKKLEEFEFRDKKNGVYRAECRECGRQLKKQHREKNKEHYKEKRKQYYENNKEQIKIRQKHYGRQYRENNKEKISKYKKQWYENNPEYNKQWYETNKEYAKEYNKQYKEKHREFYKEYSKQYYENNKNNNLVRITNMLYQVNPLLKKLNIKAYGCIYKITGINNHVYIGQTTHPLKERYRLGIIKGWIKERKKKVNQKFLEELEDENNFTIEIIDYGVCEYHLNALEVYYIDKYDSYNNGYNNQAGKYGTDDGLKEFLQILKENNLEFVDNKIIKKRLHE